MYKRFSFFQILGKALKIWWIIVLSVSIVSSSITDLSWIQAYINIDWSLLGLEAIGIVFVLLLAVGIYCIHPGIMGFGWWRLVNRLAGNEPKRYDDGTPKLEGSNINIMGTNIKYVGVAICLLLLTALPRWAAIEEQWFRQVTVD